MHKLQNKRQEWSKIGDVFFLLNTCFMFLEEKEQCNIWFNANDLFEMKLAFEMDYTFVMREKII